MKCFLLAILFICCLGAHAQQPDIVFHHITEKEGLSYNIINSFLKDSRGLLWIGTYNGLNRYDGAHFYTYHSGYEKNTLPNNTVHDLAEDKKGNIWGATDKGVFCLNANTGHFKNYNIHNKQGWSGSYNILCDNDGTIWASNTFQLSFFNAATDSFQSALVMEKHNEYWIVKNGMAAGPDGNSIWIATTQGLQCYDKKLAKFITAANSNNSSLFNTHRTGALCKTSYGHYWYVDEVTKSIIGFDPVTKRIQYNIKSKELESLGFAATLFEDNNHVLWLCTWDYKLHTIDYLHGNTVTRIRHNRNDLSSVAGDFFWDAMQEADGTLWLGTVGGISKCNLSKSFYKVHQMLATVNSTANAAINFVTENPLDNTWWLATRNRLLIHYNPVTSKTVTYGLGKFIPDKNKKRPDQLNRAIFLKDSVLLFANNGAWIKNKGANNFSPILLSSPFDTWVLRDAVLYKNHILYCTSVDKLLRWDLQTGRLDSLVYTMPFIKEGNNLFLEVPVADAKGKVWMLNGWNWLTYTDSSKLHPIKMNYQDSTEADDGYFTAMIMDRKGDLWMSKKGDGLIYYNPLKNISKQFKQHDGLIMDHIMAVAEDVGGQIWSAAYNQFSVYNPLLNSFYNFTLPLSANNYAYVNFMAPLQNGNIIASIGGDVVEFFTAKLKQHQVKEKPLISMLSVNGLDSNLYSGNALQLAPDENSLRINFGMLTDNVLTPYNMLYILEGAEKNWSTSTTNFEARYNSLPPGDYVFKVKAVAKDKSWQTSETAFSIVISTPYYKAWWFLIVIVAMLIGIMFMVYRYRIGQQHQVFYLKSKAESLEKEKTMIQYESLKQQLNPHFLFNSLTSLRSLIKTDSKTAAWFLDALSKVYRYVLKSADQQLVLVNEEVNFVSTFAKLQKVRFGDGFHVNIKVSDASAQKHIAPVILQNLLENAIKHNTTSTDRPLIIDIFDADDYLHVRNNLQRYRIVETSNRQGLLSLRKLYSFYTEKVVVVKESEQYFIVSIPLL